MARIRLLLTTAAAAALPALFVLAACTGSSGGGSPASSRASSPAGTTAATSPAVTQPTTPPPPVSSSASSSPRSSSTPAVHSSPPVTLTGILVTDLSFVGTEHGWALGTRPCAAGSCSTVARTRDGGKTWQALAGPSSHVTHLRFASDKIGYAFSATNGAGGGSLFMTTNGGKSWRQQPGNADALEILNGTVIRVVDGGGCPPGCTYRVEVSTPGSTSWRSEALPRPGLGDGVTLARTGHDAYLADYGNPAGGAGSAHPAVQISHDDGRTWATRRDPCPTGSGDKEVDLSRLTTAPDGSVVGLCTPRVQGPQFVIVSTNHGHTFTAASKTALGTAGVTVIGAATAHVVLAMSDQLYRSTDGGGHFGKVVGPIQAGFIGFETSSVGRVLSGGNTVWTTRDGGSTWTSARVH